MADPPTYNFGPIKLDKSSTVSVGLLLTLGALFFGAWNYLEDRFAGLHRALDGMDRRMERLESEELRTSEDRWSYTDMRLWASEFKRANPNMTIPNPEK